MHSHFLKVENTKRFTEDNYSHIVPLNQNKVTNNILMNFTSIYV